MTRTTQTHSWLAQIRPTLALSFLVWLLGASFAVVETTRLTGSLCTFAALGELKDYVRWCLVTMSLFTLVHQMLIFYTIHKLEDRDSEYSDLYDNWIGTTFEVILRLLAIGIILCVGGELPNFFWFNLGKQAPPIPTWIYPVSSLVLFGLLFIWDCLALKRSATPHRWTELFRHPLQGQRAFFWSDLLGLIYFFVISLATLGNRLNALGIIFLLATLILYGMVIGARTVRYASKRKERKELVAAATVTPGHG